jgi:lipopolysaccharide/colanic/teichoic acid biosynthesis glycosyltransferase
MSLVGPRPPLVSEYVRFTEYQKQKVAVKPGITCLWQVNGRNEVMGFDEWETRLGLRLPLDIKIPEVEPIGLALRVDVLGAHNFSRSA